jgi:hypothetical protein
MSFGFAICTPAYQNRRPDQINCLRRQNFASSLPSQVINVQYGSRDAGVLARHYHGFATRPVSP